MFGKNSSSHVPPSAGDEAKATFTNLYAMAEAAFAQGDFGPAAHLYLAAFDASALLPGDVPTSAIAGLRKAWEAALATKDRALAEHVFEKLEPYNSSEQIMEHTEALQRLALDKLEEFGFTRDDLQDMADMVSEDFMGLTKGTTPDTVFAQAYTLDKKTGQISRGPRHARPAKVEPETKAPYGPEGPEQVEEERLYYDDLVGFGRSVAAMRKHGIGLGNDPAFNDFLDALERRHGISGVPSLETTVFASHSREDANQFMAATAYELGLPTVRMFMENTPMGYPVLCVMTTSDFRFNPMSRGNIPGPATLVLEDVDLWGVPFSNDFEDTEGMPYYAYMSRGAREAVMFVRAAVENPDVHVMATCANDSMLDDFFLDLLDPINYIEIDVPNEQERDQVWACVADMYPSLRAMDRFELVRLSSNLSRADIFSAAREAVDQAYKESVEARTYVPVTSDNLYNKIAAYQPLESAEYQELEDAVVAGLMRDLDSMETEHDDSAKGTE